MQYAADRATADKRALQLIGLTLAAFSVATSLIAGVFVHHAVTADQGGPVLEIRGNTAQVLRAS